MAETVQTYRSALATSRAEAAGAGLAMLKQGGNAIDAAVAAVMAHCVISISQVGFGGYGGTMVVWVAADRRAYALDFDARAPLGFRPELYKDPKLAQHGYLSVGAPGVVAGLDAALRRFGTFSFKTTAAPALELAEKGFVVPSDIAAVLKTWAASANKDSLDAILRGGPPPKAGETWAQPDLAEVIRSLGDDPRAFYTGEIGKTIVKEVRAHGGILSEEDLARYQPEITEPLHITYRGHDLYTPPPPAGGITSLSILKTLEQFPLEQFPAPEYKPWGAGYFELFLKAAQLCWRERARWLGDPEFVGVPVEQMLSSEAAEGRARIIRGAATQPATRPLRPAGEHTVNVVAGDEKGNLVSITATHGDGFGSHVAVKGLGLFLGHGMSRFTYPPGDGSNAPRGGKRMQHNMCPLIAVRDGKPRAALGLPGGTRIVTVTAQLAASVIDFHATASEAVNAPRVHVETEEPIDVASTVPPDVVAELEAKGHKIKKVRGVGGPAGAVLVDSKGAATGGSSIGEAGVVGVIGNEITRTPSRG